MSSAVADSLKAIPVSILAAFTDVTTLVEFAGINYVVSIIGSAALQQVPPGMARNLAASLVASSADLAKFIIYSSNMAGASTGN